VVVVLISAFYYVAVAAKLVAQCKKGEGVPKSTRDLGAPEVCEALAELMREPTSDAKDVANAARLHAVLHRLFDPSHLRKVRCFFARDWELEDGSATFRTTWTAGWWLDALLEEYQVETLPSPARERAATVVRPSVPELPWTTPQAQRRTCAQHASARPYGARPSVHSTAG